MNIQKFGGTSVGSPANMKHVASLVNNSTKKIVVLSAMSGTTNELVAIGELLKDESAAKAKAKANELLERYKKVIAELLTKEEFIGLANNYIKEIFGEIDSIINNGYSADGELELLSKGELLSTHLVHFYQKEQGQNVALIPALEFMCINEEGEPQINLIREKIAPFLQQTKDVDTIVTQGFICRDAEGKVSNLKRGGSDYSASLIGAAVEADVVEIWTDIDGMHNNDPRCVENTTPIRHLSFDEAAELAYFGAKILHPFCIFPAQEHHIPVLLKNTMAPEAEGTFISENTGNRGFKAVAAKDGITAIKIKSSRMLMAYGFLHKVFEIFDRHRTPIDMITTSEVAVSLTIDNDSEMDAIITEISRFATVETESNLSIVCVVGVLAADSMGMANQITEALKTIPLRMISYGGSEHNISVLVKSEYKKPALQQLHKHLF